MAPVMHSTRVKTCSDLEMRWINNVQPLEKSPSERLSLLIPTKFTNVAVSEPANERADTDYLLKMPTCEPYEEILFHGFWSM